MVALGVAEASERSHLHCTSTPLLCPIHSCVAHTHLRMSDLDSSSDDEQSRSSASSPSLRAGETELSLDAKIDLARQRAPQLFHTSSIMWLVAQYASDNSRAALLRTCKAAFGDLAGCLYQRVTWDSVKRMRRAAATSVSHRCLVRCAHVVGEKRSIRL